MGLRVALLLVLFGIVPADLGNVAPRAAADRTAPPRPIAREDAARPFGRSALGHRLRVTAFGTASVARKVLVVGCIHGTECAGRTIGRRVLSGCPPLGADVWVVRNLNPDGYRLGTRLNARGVDLNRNFPAGWRPRGRAGDSQYSGPRPLSEPETRAAVRLIERVRPAVTIWFHQQTEPLVRAFGPSVPAARRYARLVGLPFRKMRWPAGTAPHWQNIRFPETSSFVVELPPGRLSRAAVRRHAAAIEQLAGYRGINSALGHRRP